jgi:hypothetical protein
MVFHLGMRDKYTQKPKSVNEVMWFSGVERRRVSSGIVGVCFAECNFSYSIPFTGKEHFHSPAQSVFSQLPHSRTVGTCRRGGEVLETCNINEKTECSP